MNRCAWNSAYCGLPVHGSIQMPKEIRPNWLQLSSVQHCRRPTDRTEDKDGVGCSVQ
ncbi:hypothetical protein BDP55DRAFT_661770 [Colletotrichum godetiae]|uniref:Uncharacterized protein n=1 Tax=Colletotrichum godetiae TaxID=1209918 RepID=A0AAJ0AQD0_9PEZI|nr:uncharacterized protein BDP55DRAFT_661770 [Colletotrichum godetiae]KAK1676663.1 hypothetical protein BDP55DRAFT_661770 [Colletotrichum godetiae]